MFPNLHDPRSRQAAFANSVVVRPPVQGIAATPNSQLSVVTEKKGCGCSSCNDGLSEKWEENPIVQIAVLILIFGLVSMAWNFIKQ